MGIWVALVAGLKPAVRCCRHVVISLGVLLFACSSSSSPPGMVWIPPGEFIMGTDQQDKEERGLELGLTKPWFEDERPARKINLPGFFIDRYEVTHKAYALYVQKTGSSQPLSWKDGISPAGQDNYPVTEVNWFQAEAYCRWAEKRLPSESEWEKTARSSDGRLFPWGNQFEPNRANLLGKGPMPVGSFPQGASPHKVDDLIGNAWEWTSDWYQPYPGNHRSSDNYGQMFKVIRGKSWTEGYGHFEADESQEILEHEARASYRLFFDPTYSFGDLGFRCAKSKPKSKR